MVNEGCADVSKMRRSTRFRQPFGASSSCVRSFPLKIQARKQTSRRIEKPAESRYRQGWFIEGAVPISLTKETCSSEGGPTARLRARASVDVASPFWTR
jgi:hypothetical protein